jgi:hypothetical protein
MSSLDRAFSTGVSSGYKLYDEWTSVVVQLDSNCQNRNKTTPATVRAAGRKARCTRALLSLKGVRRRASPRQCVISRGRKKMPILDLRDKAVLLTNKENNPLLKRLAELDHRTDAAFLKELTEQGYS